MGPFFTREFNFFGCGALGLGPALFCGHCQWPIFAALWIGACWMRSSMPYGWNNAPLWQPNNHCELTQRCWQCCMKPRINCWEREHKVYVCVCVWEREREREVRLKREKEIWVWETLIFNQVNFVGPMFFYLQQCHSTLLLKN